MLAPIAPCAAPQVLVYDTVVSECGLAPGTLPPVPDTGATLDNLRAAYRAAFEAHRPQGKVALLLQLLLAAQEPLSTSLLQQLGIGGAELRSLPGWGCLFIEAEHHVHMLHKSLSDWLLLPAAANPFRPDVSAGHKALGTQLLKDALRASGGTNGVAVTLPDYCLKYTVLHLCQAGPECAPLLDQALACWEFLDAAIKAGRGGKLLTALGDVPLDKQSPYARDTYRCA